MPVVIAEMVDAGLQAGGVSLEQGARRLEDIGSTAVQARKQARRISLTPAYQLCYTLGRHGFLDLRGRVVPPRTLKQFHETVLSAGQASFSLLDAAFSEGHSSLSSSSNKA